MQKDTATFIKTMLAVFIVIGGATGFNHALASTRAHEEEEVQKYKNAETTLSIVLERRALVQELARIEAERQAQEIAVQQTLEDGVRKGKLQALRDAQAAAQATTNTAAQQATLQAQHDALLQAQQTATVSRMKPVTVQTKVRTTQAS